MAVSLLGALLAVSGSVGRWLDDLLYLYGFILIARALMSWIPIEHGSPFEGVVRVLVRLTEPVLAPIRRAVPPVQAGGAAIDLSIIIAMVVLLVVGPLLVSVV
jgi:YggT family protein